ncbi:RidA family protein [Vagococcus silagei]|uniref:RidA family protein n=1 Tax=Vagococcus silagei TaxID=2508885 RepID=A0A4S3B214_9ENTE|nr:RidA family protein [Vagococcus silagei]THB61164.1 RidA family protein [Vagococcus silagei]
MSKKIINSNNAPEPIGPYSHSVMVDQMLYVSGQLGIDPSNGQLKTTLEAQTTQAFINLESILNEAGLDFKNVAKTTLFITDMANFAAVNNIYSTYFTSDYPARSCVAVAQLPMDALFEIEVIATK